ncbi:MAG: hypothetical protein AAGC93_07975 [Cyanobacteria bacterium P01_F01_bin.53]
MVSAPQSPPPPPTITILAKECRGEISLRQLAKMLEADVANVRKAKKWLIENRHASFQGYELDSPLNAEQAETIICFRSHTTQGIKGDELIKKMFPNPQAKHQKKEALRDLFERHHLSPCLAAKLTHSILEIFHR